MESLCLPAPNEMCAVTADHLIWPGPNGAWFRMLGPVLLADDGDDDETVCQSHLYTRCLREIGS